MKLEDTFTAGVPGNLHSTNPPDLNDLQFRSSPSKFGNTPQHLIFNAQVSYDKAVP